MNRLQNAFGRAHRLLLFAAGLLAGLALSAAGFALASDPGSKEDPLVTMAYVKGLAQFSRVDIRAGKSLRLGSGAEMVVIEPTAESISVKGVDAQKSGLINLSSSERVGGADLEAYQHYLNAAPGDQYIKFNVDATLLVRGDWQ